MSVVITSDRVQGYVLSLMGYIKLWISEVERARIAPGNLPDWDIASGQLLEEQSILENWLTDQGKIWRGFRQQWKYHLFLGRQDLTYKQDWPPPLQYTSENAPRYALRQYPQERVRIPDPTDSNGRKRSIRVHFAETKERTRR